MRPIGLTVWINSLFLTDKKVTRVWVFSSIFYHTKKCVEETALSFVERMKLNVRGYLIQYAELKFNCSINGLRKDEKMQMTMLVLVIRASQLPMKTLQQSEENDFG